MLLNWALMYFNLLGIFIYIFKKQYSMWAVDVYLPSDIIACTSFVEAYCDETFKSLMRMWSNRPKHLNNKFLNNIYCCMLKWSLAMTNYSSFAS